MGNPGSLRGNVDFRGTYNPIPRGGSWSGNRGRISIDEIRLWGQPDNAGRGAARVINTNALQGVGLIFPQDVGSVINALSGTIILNGVGTPFNAVYNTAGTIQCSTNSAATTAVLENNTVVQNTPGTAVSLLGLASVIAGTTYIGAGTACSVGGSAVDISSAPQFDAAGGGTLTCSSVINYLANMGCQAGATITTYRGFVAQNINGNTGAVTNLINIDLPLNTLGGTLNNAIRIGSGSPTLTATPAGGNQVDFWPGTVTLNYANSGLLSAFVNASGTVQCQQSASVLGIFLSGLFNFNMTFKNKTTVVANLAAVVGFKATPTFTADGASISVGTVSSTVMFRAVPTTAVVNAGTLSAITLTNFASGMAVGASTTVTQLTHFMAAAASITGTLTTEIGLDVGALAGATAIGIRNASTTSFTPSSAQTLVATTQVSPNATVIQINSAGNITLTHTPTIAAGQNGQVLVICNNQSNSITFQSVGTLASSGLDLGAATRALLAHGTLTLVYDSGFSLWLEIGFSSGGN
jgi:hypothetical protein